MIRKPLSQTGLSILSNVPKRPVRGRAIFVHGVRLLLLAISVFLIRNQHHKIQTQLAEQNLAPKFSLNWLLQELHNVVDAQNQRAVKTERTNKAIQGLSFIISRAERIEAWSDKGIAKVVDSSGVRLASIIHTSAESKSIVGYVGPTYLLILLDPADRILATLIYDSEDTPEHVSAVRKDHDFLMQWHALTWAQAAEKAQLSTVSGATLTSLAIINSVRQRLGNPQPSMKFPEPVEIGELRQIWKEAERFVPDPAIGCWFKVLNGEGAVVGYFFRSTPLADAIIGYQGPTDFLTCFNADKKYLQTIIRSSFDNHEPEPFVDYVRDEDYFLIDQFQGFGLNDLASHDASTVEGVSGATMTSTGIFRALQFSAQTILKAQRSGTEKVSGFGLRLRLRDWGTLGVLVTALLVTFSSLKHSRLFRRVYQWTLIIYLGLINGDLLSQTLMMGWVQNGIPWKNALGLVVLSAAAISIPVFSKRNLYCHAICPFGAAQHLAGNLINKRARFPKRINKIARKLPTTLLVFVVIAVLWDWKLNLASIEPFDAFNIRIAGWATLAIAIVGLLISIWIPMAYCRYGCPTGACLNYLRRHARSDQLGLADWVAGFIVMLVFIRWWTV